MDSDGRSSEGGNSGPLGGIKVVEFAQNVAVPYCGRLLAGMGADVVKVEPPGGDVMRRLSPVAPDEGKVYAAVNPGKRSIVLDLTDETSLSIVDALFGWADVALLGFKKSDLTRFGLDWERARQVNPRLVHLTATAFGIDGPDANVGGYDGLAQARSGVGFIMNRVDNDMPVASRPATIDVGTGIASALGVVAALRHRDLTGEGQRVDSSLLGTALAYATPIVNYFDQIDRDQVAELSDDIEELRRSGAGFTRQRELYEKRMLPGNVAFRLYFRPYETADGMISVAGISPGLIDKFHRLTGLGRPSSRPAASDEVADLIATAEALFRTRTSAKWLSDLREVGFPAAPYHHPYEALEDQQARANNYVVDIDHPTFGRYTTTGQPIRFSASPGTAPGPSPALGEHTEDVWQELGLEF